MAGLLIAVTFVNLLKGHIFGLNNFTSQAISLSIILVFVVWVRTDLLDRARNGGPVLSDIEWDETNTIHYPLLATGAGLVGGMFGIGKQSAS